VGRGWNKKGKRERVDVKLIMSRGHEEKKIKNICEEVNLPKRPIRFVTCTVMH
jgi:hypothetical protein